MKHASLATCLFVVACGGQSMVDDQVGAGGAYAIPAPSVVDHPATGASGGGCRPLILNREDLAEITWGESASSLHLVATPDAFTAMWRLGFANSAMDDMAENVWRSTWTVWGETLLPLTETGAHEGVSLATDGTDLFFSWNDGQSLRHLSWLGVTSGDWSDFASVADLFSTEKGAVHPVVTLQDGTGHADVRRINEDLSETFVSDIAWDVPPGSTSIGMTPVGFHGGTGAIAVTLRLEDGEQRLELVTDGPSGSRQTVLGTHPAEPASDPVAAVVQPLRLFPAHGGFVVFWSDRRAIPAQQHLTLVTDKGTIVWERNFTDVDDVGVLPTGGFVAATYGHNGVLDEVGTLFLDSSGMAYAYMPILTRARGPIPARVAAGPVQSTFGLIWADDTDNGPGAFHAAFGACR